MFVIKQFNNNDRGAVAAGAERYKLSMSSSNLNESSDDRSAVAAGLNDVNYR
jgi:hypothetical protein